MEREDQDLVGEDLRALVDEAYPTLDDVAWQQLVLQRYFSE